LALLPIGGSLLAYAIVNSLASVPIRYK